MTIFKKGPLTAVALGALLVGAVSCGGTTPASGTTSATTPTGTTTTTTTTPTTTPTTTTTTSSIKFTTAADVLVGTAAADTFDGSNQVLSGQTVITCGSADSVDGLGGTDIVFCESNNAAALVIAMTKIANVEILTLQLSAATAAYTFNAQSADASLTTINVSNNNTAAASVTNVPAKVATVNLGNTNQNFTLSVLATVFGTTDILALNLSSVTAGTVSLTAASGSTGYAEVDITSNGGVANVLTGLTTDNSVTKIKVLGAQDVNLGVAFNNGITTLDATTFTGRLTATTGTSNITITGGTGNDTIQMDGTYSSADTINCAAGTGDQLRLNSAQAVVTTAQANVTNCEQLRIADACGGTLNMTYFAGVTTTVLDTVAAATALTGAACPMTFPSGTNTLTLNNDDTANAITVTTSGSATTDVLTVNQRNADSGAAFTSTGAETVNWFSSTGIDGTAADGAANTATSITMTASAANETFVLTGDVALTLTGAFTADTINASAYTGALTMAVATVATGGATITGGSGNDTLFGSTSADILSGGVGNDRLIGSSSQTALVANQSDVMTGGSGADTFVIYDTIAGAATVSNATNGALTKITDFVVGTDKLSFITGGPATSITFATAQTIGTCATVAVACAPTAIAASVAAGALSAVLITCSTGASAGTFLYVNDTTAGVSATNDLCLDVTGVTGTISASDVVFN